MKQFIKFALLLAGIFLTAAPAGAKINWTPEDLSGYYKFAFWDGNTYAFRIVPGEGRTRRIGQEVVKMPTDSVRVYVLETPNKEHYYWGKLEGGKIYFSDGERSPVYAEAIKNGEGGILIRALDPNTDEVREFTVERATKEEAERITRENKVGDLNNACMQNLEAINRAIGLYMKEHERMPDSLEELYPDYVQDKQVFVCPVGGGEFQDFEQDYSYVRGVDPQSENPHDECIIIESKGNHVFPWRFHYELRLDGTIHAVADRERSRH
ncbi:MAG: hypothetical protein C4520_15360 [Candidatus Abyssobacteria bacterium SURF_5]|uniref:DUF3471 domain-containing protein n=1 Tax=Abyssobacteria bacterium (strain SURF_5) TaxID=2093360 RepID=A0A3A4NEL6_ABYX5|nr:MAG: hypothetical protein C4520_15360 [Candidatus Abyssubacteria bacterium SURF_5]